MEAIYLAAIFQGLFQVAILLSRRSGDRSANRMLALLIGLLTLSLWNLYSYKQELPAYWRLIDYNGWYSPLFWGPSIYLYALLLSGLRQIIVATLLRHFSIGILFFVLGTLLDILHAMEWISSNILDTSQTIQLLAFYIQITLYIYASFQVVNSYNEQIKNQFSATERINLIWLQRLIFVFAVLIAIDMTITVPHVLRSVYPIPFLDYYLLAEAIAIYLIGYLYMQRAENLPVNSRPKYESSPLDDHSSQILLNNLEKVMKESRPYLNPELKLGDLAELVDTHPHYLSQLINERLGKNFYDFVNDYRAEFAINLVVEKHAYTITDIAYEAGFNNRASFNKTFKKQTGMTPSQYRRNNQASHPEVHKST